MTDAIKKKITPYPIVRQPSKENIRQTFRKNRTLSSRFMDNYFNPKIHERVFLPNGLFIIKKYIKIFKIENTKHATQA